MYRLTLVCYCIILALGASVPNRNISLTSSGNKIVGGSEVGIRNFPYQVAIEYISVQFCGGSIITPKHILSSGRCFENYEASEIKIRYGSGEQFDPLSQNVIKASRIIVHPKYNSTEIDYLTWANDYDAAIIELEEEIIFSETAQPIKLVNAEPEPGTNVTISGWGDLEEGLWPPPCLHSLTLPLIERAKCEEDYAKYYPVNDRMICAQDGKGSCDGDRGGPVVTGEIGNRTLVGIISWSLDCAQIGYPDVYTNIAHPEIRNFILEQAGV